LEAVGADDALDEAAAVERQRPAGGLPGVVLSVPLELAVGDGDGLATSADSPGAQLVVGMVCGIRIEAGVLVQRARAKLSTSQFWNCSRRVMS
jgi:hypothetical protein